MDHFRISLTIACACVLTCVFPAESTQADEPAAASGFIDLFDGESLAGWDGDSRFWRVEEGVIVGETTADIGPERNTFLIHRGGEFGNFELRMLYQVEGYNSGVQYRSVDKGDFSVAGYQCDFEAQWHKPKGKPDAEGTDTYTGMFFEEGGRGFMGQRGEAVIARTNPAKSKKAKIEQIGSVGDAAELESHIKRDDWNELVVIANGNQFLHIINGHVMAIGIDEDAAKRRSSGLFAFQLHKGPPMKIQLKDIRVRRLGATVEQVSDASPQKTPTAPAASPVSKEKEVSDKNSSRKYEQYALRHAGDPAKGQKLFDDKRTKCIVCHKIGGKGGDVGVDLSRIGGKFDRPHLIESLLEPSRQIVEGYRTASILTHDGKVISGIIKQQNEQQVTVVDANAKQHVIKRDDIDELSHSSVSMMPEGLAKELPLEEFTDLIAYLESLGAKNVKKGGSAAGPLSIPDGFDVQTVATGLDGVTALEVLPDGRVLVCEQPGSVRVIENGKLLKEPFVTLPVESYWERGVIGVTHDPEFPKKPFIYVCWTAKDPYPHHHVSRFTMKGNVAVAGSEKLLLVGDDQSKMGGKVPAGHQGGALHFGKDGKLYIGIGEQTAGAPSQALDTFLGKILRVNADGTIPDDNPFIDEAKGKYRAIWAYGARNPFTFAFRKTDGLMLINDVGGKLEEINVGRAGANYGWPVVEHGDRAEYKTEEYDGPIHGYPQSSINGGDFCAKGNRWPKQWQGRYFFADYVQGWIHTLDPDKPSDVNTFLDGIRQPVDMRFAPDGSLYLLLRNAWVIDDKFGNGTGSLLKITPADAAKTAGSQSVRTSKSTPANPETVPSNLPDGKVQLTVDAVDKSANDLPAFKIETASATYFLEKEGGGLSSLLDHDGNDWIGFHPKKGSGAGGEYRGFPNAVHKQGGNYFHAKNQYIDSMTTHVEHVVDGYVSILAESADGQWQGRYEFFATHCTFSITKMPTDKHYWVLYEGTPGGELNLDDWWMTSAINSPQPISKKHNGDIPAPEWIAFGDAGGERAIVLRNHTDDSHPDSFYQMKEKMTVFGFGRKGIDSFLSNTGQRFSIGLIESRSHDSISKFADRMAKLAATTTATTSDADSATSPAKPLSSTSPSSTQPLSIDVWYGPRQRFGHNGNPQRWVNVLGRLKGHRQSTTLEYSLNGGDREKLSIGPNRTRLANRGDFNVEIDRSDLNAGENTVALFASEGTEQTTTTVTIDYTAASPTPLPLLVDWSKATRIEDVAQVTDGLWKLTPEGLRVVEPYYDRVIAIGDESWTDYEVTVPVTFHGFRKPGPEDGGRNVIHAAIAVRWPGHHDDKQPIQPRKKWYPLGATAEFMIQKHPDECRWRILGGGGKKAMEGKSRQIEFDKQYMLKHRVESTSKSTTTYRVKFWDAAVSEPKDWDVTAEEEGDVANGGALLLAHYSILTFGNVTVTPILSDLTERTGSHGRQHPTETVGSRHGDQRPFSSRLSHVALVTPEQQVAQASQATNTTENDATGTATTPSASDSPSVTESESSEPQRLGPQPGDVYREYTIHNGGNFDWRVTDPRAKHKGAQSFLPNPILNLNVRDLNDAVRAEAVLDRWGGHAGTKEKLIRFNGNDWITLPELTTTPEGHAPERYHSQDNPVVAVPLEHLLKGDNVLEGMIGPKNESGWGQWGLYSLILRVYYDPDQKPHSTGKIVSPVSGATLDENPTIELDYDHNTERIDVLAWYDGYDEDGNGVYNEWHGTRFQPFRGQTADLQDHVGSIDPSSTERTLTWKTHWIPDQHPKSIKLIARLQSSDDLFYVTDVVEDLSLNREGVSVKQYRATDVPEAFSVRMDRKKTCNIPIPAEANLGQAQEAVLHFRTWEAHDGHHEPFQLNGHAHLNEGKNHHYDYDLLPIPVEQLKTGDNTFAIHSKTEHHMLEVLWPGPAITVRYRLQ